MRPDERRAAEEAVHRIVARQGYEVLKLTISNGRHLVLTLDADPGPVTIHDVTAMNYKVRDALGKAGLDTDAFSIEVESPGVRRPLLNARHFERFAGERARVKLKKPLADGNRVVVGAIAEVRGSRISLSPKRGAPVVVDFAEVEEASLDPEYRT